MFCVMQCTKKDKFSFQAEKISSSERANCSCCCCCRNGIAESKAHTQTIKGRNNTFHSFIHQQHIHLCQIRTWCNKQYDDACSESSFHSLLFRRHFFASLLCRSSLEQIIVPLFTTSYKLLYYTYWPPAVGASTFKGYKLWYRRQALYPHCHSPLYALLCCKNFHPTRNSFVDQEVKRTALSYTVKSRFNGGP